MLFFMGVNFVPHTKGRRMKLAAHITHMGEMRNTYNILVRNSERKRPCGRTSHRWKYNIRMDLREIGWEGVDSICLARYRE
jgi:hypothetical protein